jgi:hypothetical protein
MSVYTPFTVVFTMTSSQRSYNHIATHCVGRVGRHIGDVIADIEKHGGSTFICCPLSR